MAVDSTIYLRAPNAVHVMSPAVILPPPLKWLSGTWKLAHSTLPRWRKSRNVEMILTPQKEGRVHIKDEHFLTLQWGTAIRDTMSWQPLSTFSRTRRTSAGLSRPHGAGGGANGELRSDLYGDTFNHGERASLVYSRRGSGWARFLESKWEILGYGIEPPSPCVQEHICYAKGNSWIVIYIAKTLLAPAGLSILCRSEALPNETVDAIKLGLANLKCGLTDMA